MNAGTRLRALGALGITVSILVAACQATTASPSVSSAGTPTGAITAPTESPPATSAEGGVVPTPTGAASPSASARSAPTATPVPSASGGGTSTGPEGTWVPAGTLASDFHAVSAVPLGDGGALVLAGDGTVAQRWDPATATWQPAAALNATRQDFAAVQLRDGRVLVTGGLNTHDWNRWQAYSSAYVYDPSTAAGRWTKVGLLGTARAAPAAAVLPDGRVLVAGGAYKDGPAHDYTGAVKHHVGCLHVERGRAGDGRGPPVGRRRAAEHRRRACDGRALRPRDGTMDPHRLDAVRPGRGSCSDPLGRPGPRRRTGLLRRWIRRGPDGPAGLRHGRGV